MSIEDPTLKVRFALTAGSHIGQSCHAVAAEIASGRYGLEVLDAKWGRKPSDWRETGGWGRQHLTEWERGFVAARSESAGDGGIERRLLDIIARVAQ